MTRLDITANICELGTVDVQVLGDDRLAMHYGADVLAIIAGKLDEMALQAARHEVGDKVLPEQLRKAQ